MDFNRVFDTTGEGLCNLLMKWVKELDLDINNIVGQCYDGASSMRDEHKDVVGRVVQIVSTTLYVHCQGHVMNLYSVDVSEAVVHSRNNFGVVNS